MSLISREPNLRFERISISRRFLWKSFSSVPFYTRHDYRRGLVTGFPKVVSGAGGRTQGCRDTFLFNRLDLVNRTDPDETVRNVEYMLYRICRSRPLFKYQRLKGDKTSHLSTLYCETHIFRISNADYSMYSTFLTSSSGSVLFNRCNLLKRKDLFFSCSEAQVRSYKAS